MTLSTPITTQLMSDTQPVTFSDNDFYSQELTQEMPSAKRQRTSSKSSRTSLATSGYKGKGKTNNLRVSWPYQKQYKPMYFDPFPHTMHAVLRYSETITLGVGTVGLPSHYFFRANGIYDPNYTGTGHQPYGHDQYEALYNHYQVMESTMTVRPCVSGDFIFAINTTPDATGNTDYNAVLEQKGCTFAHCMDNAGVPPTLSNRYKDSTFSNKNQQSASFGASPADPYFYDLVHMGRDITASVSAIYFHITITYKVKMWEPKLLTVS